MCPPIDYSIYPKNWHTEIRPAVLARAKNRCEQCQVRNYAFIYRGSWWGNDAYQYNGDNKALDASTGELLGYQSPAYPISVNCDTKPKAIKIILTVAHLDHDETNHDVKLDRLKALCQRCHIRYDAQEKVRRHKVKQAPGYPNAVYLAT